MPRQSKRWLGFLCFALLCGCESQPDVIFTATQNNAAVLGLNDSRESCERGGSLAYLTNETRTLRGCWVRTKGDIRASFGNMPEIRIPTWQFQSTELAGYRNLALESFGESSMYASSQPASK